MTAAMVVHATSCLHQLVFTVTFAETAAIFLHASSCLLQLFKGPGGSWTLEPATSCLLQLMSHVPSWAMDSARD